MSPKPPDEFVKDERLIPVPPSLQAKFAAGRPRRFRFEMLNVGESMSIAIPRGVKANQIQSDLCSAAHAWRKKFPEFRYTTRVMGPVVRVWRLA